MSHRLSHASLSIATLLVASASIAAAQAPSFEPPVLLDLPMGTNSGSNSASKWPVAVRTGASGAWVTVWSGSLPDAVTGDNEILFSRSLDGGLTFSNTAVLNSDADSDEYSFYDQIRGMDDQKVALAGDSSGTLVAVWERKPLLSDYLMLSRSTDAGQTWSAPALLESVTSGLDMSIATDGAGKWVVVWANRVASSDHEIRSSRSTDGGQTWSAPAPLFSSDPVRYVTNFPPSLVWSDGTWMLTWASQVRATGERDVTFARSVDGGATWTPASTIESTWNVNPGSVTASDGDGNWVMACPVEAVFEGSSIAVSRSSDDGATWTAAQLLPTPAGSIDLRPRLAASPSGTFVAVWDGFNGAGFDDDQDVFMSASPDLGATWSAFQTLNEATPDDHEPDNFPYIAYDPAGHWLAFWSSWDRRLANGTKRQGADIVVSLGDHTCGNGLPDVGEDCDTGRRGDLDCCSNVCDFDSSGTACAPDDELCTLERCDGSGACENLTAPEGTACTPDDDRCSVDSCNASAVCEHVLEPRGDCKAVLLAGASKFRVEIGDEPEDSSLRWNWGHGESTTLYDFMQAVEARKYSLCVFDGSGLRGRVDAAPGNACSTGAGQPCWKGAGNIVATETYKNRGGVPGGMTSMKLRDGAGVEGKAKIKLQAKGANLVPPALPLATPLVVQLNNDVACWEATYSTPEESSPTSFEAESD
jgi:hypothetical protein